MHLVVIVHLYHLKRRTIRYLKIFPGCERIPGADQRIPVVSDNCFTRLQDMWTSETLDIINLGCCVICSQVRPPRGHVQRKVRTPERSTGEEQWWIRKCWKMKKAVAIINNCNICQLIRGGGAKNQMLREAITNLVNHRFTVRVR